MSSPWDGEDTPLPMDPARVLLGLMLGKTRKVPAHYHCHVSSRPLPEKRPDAGQAEKKGVA